MVTNASELASQLRDEFLTCALCFSCYQKPKLLSCQHTFCCPCLERWIVSRKIQRVLTCPVCREASALPSEGADGFTNNIFIRNLVEYLRANVKDVSEKKGLVFEYGEKGSGDGYLYKPQSVATTRTGDVVVADCKNRLQIFDEEGKYKRKITLDHLEEKFVPSCISIARNGDDDGEELVYASDINNKRVIVCTLAGDVVREIGKGHLHMPGGVVIDGDGGVNVVDVWSNTVRTFDADSELARQFGGMGDGDGEMCQPKHLAITKSGDLAVADTQNCRVQIFDGTGRFLRKFGSKGKGDGEFLCPSGVAVDRFGNFIVADSRLRRLQMFTYWGRYIRRIDSEGDGLKYPEGVAIATSGTVYVADSGCHKIKAFHC